MAVCDHRGFVAFVDGGRLGRRSYRNTTALLNDVLVRGRIVGFPLIATDGFEYYFGAIVRLIGPACVYGQVIKTRRNNRALSESTGA